MGQVDLDGDGKLQAFLESPVDVAALDAALRAIPGTDACHLAVNTTVSLDPDNAANILALHACRFRWMPSSLIRALDELAPYALQSVTLHSGMRLKSLQRMTSQAQELAKRLVFWPPAFGNASDKENMIPDADNWNLSFPRIQIALNDLGGSIFQYPCLDLVATHRTIAPPNVRHLGIWRRRD
jgi:hypothetical protein